MQHLAAEEDGFFWVSAAGEGSDDGVPHECVGFSDSVEELEGIRLANSGGFTESSQQFAGRTGLIW